MNTPQNPIGYTELHTNDPARARSFYSELLGWSAQEEKTPMGPYWMFQGLLAGLTENRDGVPFRLDRIAGARVTDRKFKETAGRTLRDLFDYYRNETTRDG